MVDFVATLIARPADSAELAAAAAACSQAIDVKERIVLCEGEAVDLFFSSGDFIEELRARLELKVARHPVDVAVQPAAGRMKRLLIADMDSTIIGQECLDELADFAGLKARVAAITERAMKGEIEFEPALR